MTRLALLTVTILLSLYAAAQPSFPPPTGVYCSCGPTTGNGYGSVNPTVAAKPFVQGILVRVGWEYLEPSDDTYNWQILDDQIDRAKQYGKKISLGIPSGILIPQWVFTNGAQRLVTSSPFNDTIAIPWDTYYLNKWTEFISEVGNRYENDTVIQLVYISHSTANGMEMQLPRTTTPTLTAAGYTDTKMINSWKTVIDAFDNAFPNHYLSNDFHPVNNSNAVADSVYEYARNTIGSRYGAGAWWWTQNNAANVYPAQYDIVKHSAANNSFTTVQFARSGTSDSAQFGAGGMQGALQLAIQDGICYWEIWNEDILNPDFDSLLTFATCATTSIEAVAQSKAVIYPNANDGNFTIRLNSSNPNEGQLNVFDHTGRLVHSQLIASNKQQVNVQLGNVTDGIYLLRLQLADQVASYKIVVRK